MSSASKRTFKNKRRMLLRKIRKATGLPLPVASKISRALVNSHCLGKCQGVAKALDVPLDISGVSWSDDHVSGGLHGELVSMKIVGPRGTYLVKVDDQ